MTNPGWEKKRAVLQEIMTANALTTWLRNQPPEDEYRFQDPVFCMMGRYLADHGAAWGDVAYSDMPHYEEIAAEKPWTFGAALERAETLKLPPPMLQLEASKEPVRELAITE